MKRDRFIPLYERLYEYYREKIIEQKYISGDQIDSISQMMRKHHVSRETSKLVLNKLVEEGLVIKIRGKGSFVTNFAEPEKKWAVILPMFTSNMEQLIGILMNEAYRSGYELNYFFHYNNPEEEKRLVGTLLREGYSALIIVPNFNEELTADFYRRLIPVMNNIFLIDFTMAGSYFNYVIQSYDLGVRRAIDYLLEEANGHLLLVKNDIWRGRNLLAELMENAFTDHIASRNKHVNSLIMESQGELTADYMHSESITGILCCQDTDALKIYSRLKRWGFSVPGTNSSF